MLEFLKETWNSDLIGKAIIIIGVLIILFVIFFIVRLIIKKPTSRNVDFSGEIRSAIFKIYEKQMVHEDGSMYIMNSGKPNGDIDKTIFVLVLQNPRVTKEKDLYEAIVDIDTYKRFYQNDMVEVTMKGTEIVSIKRDKSNTNSIRETLGE